ncbi:MAG: hypothetical protein U0234_00475 [Sandaracinus sp.]
MTSRRGWASFAVCAFLLLAPAGASAQRLGGVSGAVHGGGGGGFGSSGGRRSGGYGGGRGRGGYGYADASFQSPMCALSYPYFMGYPGVGVRQDAIVRERRFEPPTALGIVDASAGYVFDGIVHGQLSATLRFAQLLSLDLRYGAYFEQTVSSEVRALGLGRLAVALSFVSDEVVQFRGGVAVQLYHDVAGVELGYSGQLELDVFPLAPLVIRAELSTGALGQALFGEGRASLGIQIDRGELYLGYRAFGVVGATAGDVLHGPIAGVRVWIS